MRITYLFRCPGTGYSIEEVFESVRQILARQSTIQVDTICLPYISQSLWSVWRNGWLLRTFNADIFHVTGDVHYTVLFLPAARTMLTIHDCSLLHKNQKQPLRYAVFWLLWYYLPIRRARTVTTVSEKSRQELLRLVGPIAQKVAVVPNGYAPRLAHQARAFRRHNPVLLQIGTAPNKNLSRLIAAIGGMTCRLIIVGPLTDALTSELRQHRIDYRQYVDLSQAWIATLYKLCDIVTFVSTYEGFGLPVIEANAVGRVVITSAIEPIKTLAGDAAHLVDPTNLLAIRAGIKRLMSDDAYRRKLLKAGRKNAQRYTAAQAANRYVALYKNLLQS